MKLCLGVRPQQIWQKKGGRGFTPPCTPLNVSVPISYLEKYSDKTLRKPLTKRMFGVLLLLYLYQNVQQ